MKTDPPETKDGCVPMMRDAARVDYCIRSLNRIVHAPSRLRLLAHLHGRQSATFVELGATLKLTDGNLWVQLRRLKEAGYVVTAQVLDDPVRSTRITLSAAGRAAFTAYVATMSELTAAFAAETGTGVGSSPP